MQLRSEAEGVVMDVVFECGLLKMQWSFSDSKNMQKIIKLLEVSGARYQVCNSSVYFWVEANSQGQLKVLMA
jgi:hypothetical protein